MEVVGGLCTGDNYKDLEYIFFRIWLCTFSGTSYLNMQILEKNDFSLRFLLMLGFKMFQYINTLKVVD